MGLETFYQLNHKQKDAYGQSIMNTYFFNHTAGSGFAIDLVQDFIDVMMPLVNQLQCNVIDNVLIEAFNLEVLSDFWSQDPTGAGALTGDMLPLFNAVSFTVKPNTRAVRKGGKRISGVPESVQNVGVITDGTYLGFIEDYRLQLATELVGTSDTWTPVIIKRVKTAISGTVPTQYRYRLPVNDSELVYGGVQSVLASVNVSSQVSRKN